MNKKDSLKILAGIMEQRNLNSTSCHKVFTNREGSFTSQNYPDEYPANSIRQPPGATIVLKLRYIQIERDKSEETGTCYFDYLEV